MARYAGRKRSRRGSFIVRKKRGAVRRFRRFPRRRNAKNRFIFHKYRRSIEGTLSYVDGIPGYWVSSSSQFAISNTAGSAAPGPLQSPTGSQATAYGGAMSFNIGYTENYSELQALYDQYRIDKVVVKIICPDGLANWNSGTPHGPTLRWYTDMNDATLPTGASSAEWQEFRERPDVKIAKLVRGKIVKIAFKPNMVEPDLLQPKRGWINWANPTQAHYGLKMALLDMTAMNSNQDFNQFFRWRVDYYITCRDPR